MDSNLELEIFPGPILKRARSVYWATTALISQVDQGEELAPEENKAAQGGFMKFNLPSD